ncbi:MAG: SAM-dependent methyltransferase [Verrucomicrobiales bacterium]
MSEAVAGKLAQLVESGWVSWESFMAIALYDEEFGFYRQTSDVLGQSGSFSTFFHRSELSGNCISNWLQKGRNKQVLELGGGSGSAMRRWQKQLSGSILPSLSSWRWHVLEISPALRAKQRMVLPSRITTWHETIAEALATTSGEADVVANEFIDAFPCVLLEWTGEEWHEVGVKLAAGTKPLLRWDRQPLGPRAQDALAGSSLSEIKPHDLRLGQRAEVHWSFREWLQSFANGWSQGRALFIDYGGRQPWRGSLAGTLRGYFRHHEVRDKELLTRIGKQDLTADVCVLDFERWVAEVGLVVSRHCSLADFLHEQLTRKIPQGDEDSRWLDVNDAGGQFFVFELERARRTTSAF